MSKVSITHAWSPFLASLEENQMKHYSEQSVPGLVAYLDDSVYNASVDAGLEKRAIEE